MTNLESFAHLGNPILCHVRFSPFNIEVVVPLSTLLSGPRPGQVFIISSPWLCVQTCPTHGVAHMPENVRQIESRLIIYPHPPSAMETQKGLLTKLALYSATAVGLVVVGKKHIASHKEDRHKLESDSTVEYADDNEFLDRSVRPGFPSNNPNLNYDVNGRESRFVGAGNSYSSRTPGDRLSIWNVVSSRWRKDE